MAKDRKTMMSELSYLEITSRLKKSNA
uniref:Uncharacterized protein n=1 Tax=Anguilla anguilla TaxID=7936 RepID=A0A0E9WC03_ANGAN